MGEIDLGVNVGLPELLGIEDDIFPDLIGIPENLGPAPGIVPASLGFYYTPTAVPEPDGENNLSVVTSANLINQAIFAIHEAGLLSPTVNILNDLNDSGLYILTDPETANTRILFSPTLSPELHFRGHIQSVAYLNVDNFDILYQRKNAQGEWKDALSMSFSAEIPLQLSVDGSKGVQLALINPAAELEFNLGCWFEFSVKFPPKLFVAKGIASILVDQLNHMLALIQLPEDLFLNQEEASLAIHPETFKTVGEPRNHFSFSASFDNL
ncbi:MAG: hypothetical protein KKD44_24490 [Proteobacteria bacterium]|nr:hypothetical protein [Pseudomonadota bacterium]